jgi:hypothetical protein
MYFENNFKGNILYGTNFFNSRIDLRIENYEEMSLFISKNFIDKIELMRIDYSMTCHLIPHFLIIKLNKN